MQVTRDRGRRATPRAGDLATAARSCRTSPGRHSAATPLAWLIPLTADPSLLADGDFTSDAVVTAVDGRGAVEAAAGRAAVGFGRIGHHRPRGDPHPRAGRQRPLCGQSTGKTTGRIEPASTAAKDWLNELRAGSNLTVIPLPYDNVDVEALLHSDAGNLADAARQRGDDVLKLGLLQRQKPADTNIVVPPAAYVDAQAATYYQRSRSASPGAGGNAVPVDRRQPQRLGQITGRFAPTAAVRQVLDQTGHRRRPATTTPRLAEQDIVAELAESHLEDRVAAERQHRRDGDR